MFMTVWVVHSKGGWHITPHTHKHEGRRFLDAALTLASQVLHLDLVATVRACRAVASMPALKLYVNEEGVAWCREGGSSAQDIIHYPPRGKYVNRNFLAQQLALEFDEIDKKVVNWDEVCFIQFLCVQSTQCKNILSIAPHMQLLAGAGAPSRRVKAKCPVDEDVTPQPPGSNLDIIAQPPSKQRCFLKIQSKIAHERPTEGIITACKPNKNARLTQQPVVKFESRKTTTSKFGNRGSADDGSRCHKNTDAVGDFAQSLSPRGGIRGGDGSDVDDLEEKRESIRFLAQVRNLVVRSPRLNNNAECIPVSDSSESAKEERSPDQDEDLYLIAPTWEIAQRHD